MQTGIHGSFKYLLTRERSVVCLRLHNNGAINGPTALDRKTYTIHRGEEKQDGYCAEMARKLQNLIAGTVVVLAIGWQIYNLAMQYLINKGEHHVDVAKLVRDIKSQDYKVQHQAASSIFMLAGVKEHDILKQLVKGGEVVEFSDRLFAN